MVSQYMMKVLDEEPRWVVNHPWKNAKQTSPKTPMTLGELVK